jgi:hypothetical protein
LAQTSAAGVFWCCSDVATAPTGSAWCWFGLNQQGYLNLKGYYEFDAKNRLDGWNAWITLSIEPQGQTHAVAKR